MAIASVFRTIRCKFASPHWQACRRTSHQNLPLGKFWLSVRATEDQRWARRMDFMGDSPQSPTLLKVRKRDGRSVEMDRKRIEAAIEKAFRAELNLAVILQCDVDLPDQFIQQTIR